MGTANASQHDMISATNVRRIMINRIQGTLVSRVHDIGDSAAADEFVFIYRPIVTSWCLRFDAPRHAAAGTTQIILASFVETIRDSDHGDSAEKFDDWLFAVTQRAVLEAVQSRVRSRPEGTTSLPQHWHRLMLDDAIEDLFTFIIEQAEIDILRTAHATIQTLVEPAVWDVWRLLVCENREPNEIADLTGLTISEIDFAFSKVTKLVRDEVSRMKGC